MESFELIDVAPAVLGWQISLYDLKLESTYCVHRVEEEVSVVVEVLLGAGVLDSEIAVLPTAELPVDTEGPEVDILGRSCKIVLRRGIIFGGVICYISVGIII